MATYEIREDPRTNNNWRIHKSGCPNYRERWFPGSNLGDGEPMYQVYCLMDTPPVSGEEQTKCMASRSGCWRLSHNQERSKTKTKRTDTESSTPTA